MTSESYNKNKHAKAETASYFKPVKNKSGILR